MNYSKIISGLSYILICYLLIVFIPILFDITTSIITGKGLSSSIRTELTSIISAFSTIILVVITAGYAKITNELLDEQVKLRKISSFEKRLEYIYSPINMALIQFIINCESLPENRIPQVYNYSFKELNDVIMNIASKYYHLIDQKIINYYNSELWKIWLQYSSRPDIDNYRLLNSRIKMFGDYITTHLNLEKESLNRLQQDGENMVGVETQTGRAQNDCPLSIKEWISFLNSEISVLKNLECQNSNNMFPIMSLFAVLATGMITWMLSIANGNTPQDFKANLISRLGNFQVFLFILFIVIVIVYICSLFIYKFNKWKVDKLEDIRNNIMNGGLTDTNAIREKWSNVMRLTYREYIKSFQK